MWAMEAIKCVRERMLWIAEDFTRISHRERGLRDLQ
jgi:hypothetical protein